LICMCDTPLESILNCLIGDKFMLGEAQLATAERVPLRLLCLLLTLQKEEHISDLKVGLIYGLLVGLIGDR